MVSTSLTSSTSQSDQPKKTPLNKKNIEASNFLDSLGTTRCRVSRSLSPSFFLLVFLFLGYSISLCSELPLSTSTHKLLFNFLLLLSYDGDNEDEDDESLNLALA